MHRRKSLLRFTETKTEKQMDLVKNLEELVRFQKEIIRKSAESNRQARVEIARKVGVSIQLEEALS